MHSVLSENLAAEINEKLDLVVFIDVNRCLEPSPDFEWSSPDLVNEIVLLLEELSMATDFNIFHAMHEALDEDVHELYGWLLVDCGTIRLEDGKVDVSVIIEGYSILSLVHSGLESHLLLLLYRSKDDHTRGVKVALKLFSDLIGDVVDDHLSQLPTVLWNLWKYLEMVRIYVGILEIKGDGEVVGLDLLELVAEGCGYLGLIGE